MTFTSPRSMFSWNCNYGREKSSAFMKHGIIQYTHPDSNLEQKFLNTLFETVHEIYRDDALSTKPFHDKK
jgi:hypothetical protein